MDSLTLESLRLSVHREALAKGYSCELSTYGTSMAPFLRGKDIVVIKSCPAEQLKCSDIVIYETNIPEKRLIAHRLIRKVRKPTGQLFLITKGDALLEYDCPVPVENVLGKVIAIKKRKYELSLNSFIVRGISLIALFLSITFIGPLLLGIARSVKTILLQGKDVFGNHRAF